jgi:hypothetical protein
MQIMQMSANIQKRDEEAQGINYLKTSGLRGTTPEYWCATT